MKPSFNNRLSLILSLSVAAGAMLIQGCATSQQDGAQASNAAQASKKESTEATEKAPDHSYIIKGKSTKAQLIAKNGPPLSSKATRTGETLVWDTTSVKMSPQTYIPIWGSFNGGMKTTVKVLTVEFNKGGIVTDYTSEFGVSNKKIGMQ